MKNMFFYVCGADGVGKTTHIKRLINYYKIQNYVWLRSPKIISKPLMLFCRVFGFTEYKTINGLSYGIHHFYKSKLISYIFPIIQLIDFKISWFFKRFTLIKNEKTIFDRFNIDTLADLMVDTHNFKLHNDWVGKEFLKMTPNYTKMVILDADEEKIKLRKKDTLFDENLVLKLKAYRILANELNIKLIRNDLDFSLVNSKIIKYFNDKNFSSKS